MVFSTQAQFIDNFFQRVNCNRFFWFRFDYSLKSILLNLAGLFVREGLKELRKESGRPGNNTATAFGVNHRVCEFS